MKKAYTKKQIQEAISYWKKQLAEGNYRKVNEAAGGTKGQRVNLTGDEQYLGPSMGKYRMTLKKNGKVQDTYEWECFLFNQANSDGCGDALDQFARNDPDFADLLAGEDEDDIRDVGIVEDSWEDPDGVYELSISPSTVQWEEFPDGWHAPMSSVVLDPGLLTLIRK